MMKLTNSTRTNKNGELVDNSIYLIHFDSRNLAIVRGKRNKDGRYTASQVIGYYGSVRSALKASIDIAIKSEPELLKLKTVLHRIDDLEEHIEKLCDARNLPAMMQVLRGEV